MPRAQQHQVGWKAVRYYRSLDLDRPYVTCCTERFIFGLLVLQNQGNSFLQPATELNPGGVISVDCHDVGIHDRKSEAFPARENEQSGGLSQAVEPLQCALDCRRWWARC